VSNANRMTCNLLTIAATCALAAFFGVVAPGCTPPSGPLPDLPVPTILSGIARTPGVRRMQASGRIQAVSKKGTSNAGILLYYRYPDSVKMIIQVGFGTTVAELLFTGPHGLAYFPHQRQAYRIRAGAALTLEGAEFYPSVVTALLRPFDIGVIADSVELKINGADYILSSENAGGKRTWQISGRTFQLSGEKYEATGGTISWERTFHRIRNQIAPEDIIVRFGETETMLFLRRINVSPSWKRSPFRIKLPENVSIHELPDA
jgi:hypothetical protein